MAPEVMEDLPYNEKIDVYSFGIVLSELLTRSIPFSDQLPVSSYLEVVELVLDDGAKPTIPKWGIDLFRDLIEQCLDRDPECRPSFTEIILYLRELMSHDLFEIDLARIIDQIHCKEASVQCRAANEIVKLCSKESCVQCGLSSGFPDNMDQDILKQLLTRLTALLNSSSVSVQASACSAIASILSIYSNVSLREIVISAGWPCLLRLLTDEKDQVCKEASRVLLHLSAYLSSDDQFLFVGLDPSGLQRLDILLSSETKRLQESLESESERLSRQLNVVQQLRDTLSIKSEPQRSPTNSLAPLPKRKSKTPKPDSNNVDLNKKPIFNETRLPSLPEESASANVSVLKIIQLMESKSRTDEKPSTSMKSYKSLDVKKASVLDKEFLDCNDEIEISRISEQIVPPSGFVGCFHSGEAFKYNITTKDWIPIFITLTKDSMLIYSSVKDSNSPLSSYLLSNLVVQPFGYKLCITVSTARNTERRTSFGGLVVFHIRIPKKLALAQWLFHLSKYCTMSLSNVDEVSQLFGGIIPFQYIIGQDKVPEPTGLKVENILSAKETVKCDEMAVELTDSFKEYYGVPRKHEYSQFIILYLKLVMRCYLMLKILFGVGSICI